MARFISKLHWQRLALLTIYGWGMAHVEGVVVYYLRKILAPMAQLVEREAVFSPTLLRVEQTREAATIVMLVAIAWLVGKNLRERLSFFLWTFAIWDIFYYVSLYLLLRWPRSLTTMDVLFLIPTAWVAPVYVPLTASTFMLLFALWLLRRG